MTEPDSLLVILAKALERAPLFFFGVLVSMAIKMVSDELVFVLTVGSVVVGILTNFWIALAVFCFTYALARSMLTAADMIRRMRLMMSAAPMLPAENDAPKG